MNDETSLIKRSPVAFFFIGTFVCSWAFWLGSSALPGTEVGPNVSQLWLVPGAFGPLLAAVLLLRVTNHDIRAWLSQALKWRVQFRWYIAAVAIPVVFKALPVLGLGAIGASVFYSPNDQLIFGFLFVFFVAGGQEEFGWRGFALPRLQANHGALIASLVIGLMWGLWHFAFFFIYEGLSATAALFFLLRVIPEAIILTWLYNSTNGSVLVCMIFHAMYNVGYFFSSPAGFQFPWGPEIPLSTMVEPIVWWVAALVLIEVYGGNHLARTPNTGSTANREWNSSMTD